MVRVYHDIGTSDLKAPDGSEWIDYWEKQTGLKIPKICPCCGNENEKFVGAHVFKYNDFALGENKPKFITPTCDSCNKRYKYGKSLEKEFEVKDEMLLPV